MHFQKSKRKIKRQEPRKLKLNEEATELKRKKSLFGNTISKLHEEADMYAYQAENHPKLESMKVLYYQPLF